ncbi:MAG: hypothetical protein A2Y12_09320 [Planctomycetes bacterium GWF2_42_9]|nr:MAG: hypothetical protein A2Y12_09320 [Planctomycetes bacterium GWF2_42_9]
MRILERTGSENHYLHKDFHGALCYAIKYLDEIYGPAVTTEFLKQVGKEQYGWLSKEIKKQGIMALVNHTKKIFDQEDGKLECVQDGESLEINVLQCPAITHLLATDQLFTNRFCETTVQVLAAICESSGYGCSCEYIAGEGSCVQRFWKEGEAN